ncbi:MAG: PrsW family intramembrane metalloprotease [Candidatus Peregrinibacteria bacterium]|nr:PrsW family intramembrane metalloprotease [Candidatus Peregrinibacteria bacterium]
MIESKYIVNFLFAIIPAAIWALLFLKNHKENRWLVFFTFVGGILAAQVILLYKGYWDSTLNLIFVKVSLVDFRSNLNEIIVNATTAAFAVFLGIGAMEEVAKFWLMKIIAKGFFRSIDDVIALAIISALGFSFYENMIYFNNHWNQLAGASFYLLVISRVTIVTMVHMLCSGVMGYYFGLAYFASPILKIQHKEKRRHPILKFLKSVLHMKKSHLYRDEMMVIGLVLAMVIHAFYDFILSSTIDLPPLVVSVTVLLYFFGGYYFLNYLMGRKEAKLEMGLLVNQVDDE